MSAPDIESLINQIYLSSPPDAHEAEKPRDTSVGVAGLSGSSLVADFLWSQTDSASPTRQSAPSIADLASAVRAQPAHLFETTISRNMTSSVVLPASTPQNTPGVAAPSLLELCPLSPEVIPASAITRNVPQNYRSFNLQHGSSNQQSLTSFKAGKSVSSIKSPYAAKRSTVSDLAATDAARVINTLREFRPHLFTSAAAGCGDQVDVSTDILQHDASLGSFQHDNTPPVRDPLGGAPLGSAGVTIASAALDAVPTDQPILLHIVFPAPLKDCAFQTIYTTFRALFDGLVASHAASPASDASFSTLTDFIALSGVSPPEEVVPHDRLLPEALVNAFSRVLAKHVNYTVMSRSKYGDVGALYQRLCANTELTVPLGTCLSLLRTELRLSCASNPHAAPGAASAPASAVSSPAASRRKTALSREDVMRRCERLYREAEKRQQRIARNERQRRDEGLEECTFVPTISQRSEELSRRRRVAAGAADASIYASLIEEGKQAAQSSVASRNRTDNERIFNDYVCPLIELVQELHLEKVFDKDHGVWTDAYCALKKSNSLKHRQGVFEELRERLLAFRRSVDGKILQTRLAASPEKRIKFEYKPYESILDAGAHRPGSRAPQSFIATFARNSGEAVRQTLAHAAGMQGLGLSDPSAAGTDTGADTGVQYAISPHRKEQYELVKQGRLAESLRGIENVALLPESSLQTASCIVEERRRRRTALDERAGVRAVIAQKLNRGGGDCSAVSGRGLLAENLMEITGRAIDIRGDRVGLSIDRDADGGPLATATLLSTGTKDMKVSLCPQADSAADPAAEDESEALARALDIVKSMSFLEIANEGP